MASDDFVHAGRPPLTERRKAATRLEIAREAIKLFRAKGVAATSAEDIAAAAGISVRTLWRYVATKESCVQPLLTIGTDLIAHVLRTHPDLLLADLIEAHDDLNEIRVDTSTTLDLVRLTRDEPSLRAVWLQAHDDAEHAFVAALAERAGAPSASLSVKVQGAMINAALRVAIEHYAFDTEPEDASDAGLREAIHTALRTVSRGISDPL